MPDKVIVSRPKDPFEILFSAAFALSGTVQLAFGATPGAVAGLLPIQFRFFMLALTVVGCVAVLVGVFWRDPISGLFVESVGLLAVASTITIYGLGITVRSVLTHQPEVSTLIAGPLTVLMGAAFYWKHRQVVRTTEELPQQ